MLQFDIIEESVSPWTSPVVLVKKKDGTWRFCVDYRLLNKRTKKDVYPLPRIDYAFDSISETKFFSSVDLKSGYWQIEVDKQNREKTAFVRTDGVYLFKFMPIDDAVLGILQPGLESRIHADASGYGIGAVQVQLQRGFERPIAYASRCSSS
ncbi:Transposon Ty3-I Gag-Pol polyprotein [Araneus ventricosus]|uniref:Transposon Ty3-I Gag-Pol polyprotein n=1 Tax=Araneus ventricosus TaxID=182803 RepID=A0A4Y2JUY6_ARAVE|nr:Transposon Ty3-I Gag-Pol polyprotein [Araneus ventricosus]